jgi:hypothetical protein
VLWHKENPARRDAFDWKAAAWTLHVPMIKALFEQVATPTKLGPLGLVEVLDWTAAALNRVDRPAFFERFVESHAVQYFYEPFLEAFDPELRKQLGVWYTPPEIVEYMVARVDTALREELHISDGLADPRVFVLDPCCGTGAYLVEVLRKIEHTLREEKGEGDNAGGHMKRPRWSASSASSYSLRPSSSHISNSGFFCKTSVSRSTIRRVNAPRSTSRMHSPAGSRPRRRQSGSSRLPSRNSDRKRRRRMRSSRRSASSSSSAIRHTTASRESRWKRSAT